MGRAGVQLLEPGGHVFGHGSESKDGRQQRQLNAAHASAQAVPETVEQLVQILEHGAAVRGWVELAKVLVAAGADPDAMDADGKTPLDYAMDRYRLGFLENQPAPQLKVAEALRALGAKKEFPDAPALPPGARPIVVAEVPVVPY